MFRVVEVATALGALSVRFATSLLVTLDHLVAFYVEGRFVLNNGICICNEQVRCERAAIEFFNYRRGNNVESLWESLAGNCFFQHECVALW